MKVFCVLIVIHLRKDIKEIIRKVQERIGKIYGGDRFRQETEV